MVASLVPGPLPDFISPPLRKISSPWLQDKIWEWPWDETVTAYAPDEEMMKTFRHCLKTSLHIMKHRPDLSLRMESLKNFSSYVNLCTKVGHNFGCHMTPAEFYASSDALVH